MIKNSAAKIFIVGSLLFAANDAYANVYYKTTYNLGAGFNNVTEGGGNGTLEGFISMQLKKTLAILIKQQQPSFNQFQLG